MNLFHQVDFVHSQRISSMHSVPLSVYFTLFLAHGTGIEQKEGETNDKYNFGGSGMNNVCFSIISILLTNNLII